MSMFAYWTFFWKRVAAAAAAVTEDAVGLERLRRLERHLLVSGP